MLKTLFILRKVYQVYFSMQLSIMSDQKSCNILILKYLYIQAHLMQNVSSRYLLQTTKINVEFSSLRIE